MRAMQGFGNATNKNADKTLILSAFAALLPYPVGWLMGLEPTTTRITIWDSTN